MNQTEAELKEAIAPNKAQLDSTTKTKPWGYSLRLPEFSLTT